MATDTATATAVVTAANTADAFRGNRRRFPHLFALTIVIVLLTLPLFGQGGRYAYIAQYQYTGTSGKCTLQIPTTATGAKARGLELVVSCPTASCTVVYTVGGALATTTLATAYRLRSSTPATSTTKFYTASNASGGTALPAIPLPSGTHTLSIEDFDLLPGEPLSFTVASTSQTVTIMPKWDETI